MTAFDDTNFMISIEVSRPLNSRARRVSSRVSGWSIERQLSLNMVIIAIVIDVDDQHHLDFIIGLDWSRQARGFDSLLQYLR